jgi:hypothetical protein
MWRSICVPSTSSGCSSAMRLDLEVVVGDQRLDAELFGRGADVAGELAAVGAEADDLEAELLAAMRAAAMAWVASPKMKTRLPVR